MHYKTIVNTYNIESYLDVYAHRNTYTEFTDYSTVNSDTRLTQDCSSLGRSLPSLWHLQVQNATQLSEGVMSICVK